MKGKVNLSMAHGQPVVATSCAVEGMHLEPGRDVLVADDAQGFADAVVELYQDAALWNTLAQNGLRNVAEHFSLDAARETVRKVFLVSGPVWSPGFGPTSQPVRLAGFRLGSLTPARRHERVERH